MKPEDHLRAYVRDGDEKAFAEVVEAFASLVYGTAFRRTRNPQLAEEITQNVFIIAARKASKLERQPGLGGWLHRTALLESNNALRSEAARVRSLRLMKEEGEIPMEEKDGLLREVMDEALNRLPAADRKAVFLRFFEGREFDEIGTQLGKSASATQKQIRRALEKLGMILSRKGVTVSTVTLAAFLTPELAKAAPPMLKATILKSLATGTTTKTTAALTTAQIMSSTKSLVTTAAVILVALIPLGMQEQRLFQKKNHLQQLPPEQSPSWSASKAAGASTGERRQGPGKGISTEPFTVQQLAEALLRSDHELRSLHHPGPGFSEFSNQLRKNSAEENWALVTALDELEMNGEVRWKLRELLIKDYLSSSDPMRALDHAMAHGMTGKLFESVMRRWASQDFEAAYDYLEKKRKAAALSRRGLAGKDPETALLVGFTQGMASADVEIAMDFVKNNIESSDALAFVKGLGHKLAGQKVGALMRANIHEELAPSSDEHDDFIGMANRLPETGERHAALKDYASRLSDIPMVSVAIDTTREFLTHSSFPEELRNETLLHAANGIDEDYDDYAFMLVHAVSDDESRASNLIALADRFEADKRQHLDGYLKPGDPDMLILHDEAFAEMVEVLSREEGQKERARLYLRKIIDESKREAVQEKLSL